MPILNTGEPFGLPKGTVRGIIALGSLALVAYSYVSTGTIDPTVLALAGPYLGFYFGTRPSDPAVTEPEPLDQPVLGGLDDAQ